MSPPLWLVILGLELPAIVAMSDCLQRPPDHFDGGAEDRTAWLRWLVVAILLVPVLLGGGIPLLERGASLTQLALEQVERYPSGLLNLRYRVPAAAAV